MRILLRSQLAAFFASAVDLLVTIFLVEVLGSLPAPANVGGNMAGGIFNFLVNRQWTFAATEHHVGWQAAKYVLVWAGYIALSYFAIHIGTRTFGWHYLPVKIGSALLLGVLYNFMLHKNFVYR